jgi:hypothetical protein
VNGPGARDQAGGAGAEAAGGQLSRGGRKHGGVAAEAQVVVAGEVQQGWGVAGGGWLEGGVGGGFEGAQGAAAGGG